MANSFLYWAREGVSTSNSKNLLQSICLVPVLFDPSNPQRPPFTQFN